MSSGRMADKGRGPGSPSPADSALPAPRTREEGRQSTAAGDPDCWIPGAAIPADEDRAAHGNPAADEDATDELGGSDDLGGRGDLGGGDLGGPGRPTAGGPRPEAWVPPRPLDDIDRSVVEILRADGRASVRSVAERVHISRGNAYNRISRLVQDGVIRGFSARVDHERAGQGSSAYITLKIVQNTWRTVREQLRELPGATHIALVSGDFDVLLLVHAADNRTLRELVLTRLQSIPEVLSTRTLLVFEEEDLDPQL